ncbi:MAG TPA: phosphate ABC transporter permease PstA [Thermoplasmata archaeon]
MTFRFDRDTRRRWKDLGMSVAALACVVIALIPLGSILVEATVRGLQAIGPSFFVLATGEGGIGNAIQGTLIFIGLASAIAIPTGILTGIYLAEFGKNRVGAAIRFFVDVMTQIPSIIAGIFAYSLILELGSIGIGDTRLSLSAIAGVTALAALMIPFVARTAEEALRLVPVSTRESALALGIPQHRTILGVVLPSAGSGLVTGALLGVARVGGETAPLLLTGNSSPFSFAGLDHPVESLPHTIYLWALSPYTSQNQAAWGASLILVLLMLTISILSRLATRVRSASG